MLGRRLLGTTRRSLSARASPSPTAARLRWQRPAGAALVSGIGAACCSCAAQTEEAAAEPEQEPAGAPRTPHALYVWGVNKGCVVPQSGADGTPGAAFGVDEAGGARGLPAQRVAVVERPQPVPFFDDKGVGAIAFAPQHAAATDAAGKLYVWGAAYQAEQPATPAARHAASQPVEVSGAGTVTQVACSSSSAYVLTDRGEVLAVPASPGAGAPAPQPVAWAAGARARGDAVVKIAAGDAHCAALTASGRLFSLQEQGWGFEEPLFTGASVGQLARVTGEELPEEQAVADVACGASHVLARTTAGRVVGYGSDRWLQLGQGQPGTEVAHRSEPVELLWGGKPKGRCTHIAAGTQTFLPGSRHLCRKMSDEKMRSGGQGATRRS